MDEELGDDLLLSFILVIKLYLYLHLFVIYARTHARMHVVIIINECIQGINIRTYDYCTPPRTSFVLG